MHTVPHITHQPSKPGWLRTNQAARSTPPGGNEEYLLFLTFSPGPVKYLDQAKLDSRGFVEVFGIGEETQSQNEIGY